jgi:hypothetical protein
MVGTLAKVPLPPYMDEDGELGKIRNKTTSHDKSK